MKHSLSSFTAVSLLADLLALFSFILLFRPVAKQFATPSSYNALILIVGFILFCIAVTYLKKLHPQPNVVDYLPVQLTAVLPQRLFAILFGVLFAFGLAHQFGYLASVAEVGTFNLDAGSASSLFSYGPGAWLGIGMIYMLILSSTAVPRFEPNTKNYLHKSLLGLLGVNLMLFLATVELHSFLSKQGWGWGILSLLLLGVLFLPPRFVYTTKSSERTHLVSFGFLLAIAAILTII